MTTSTHACRIINLKFDLFIVTNKIILKIQCFPWKEQIFFFEKKSVFEIFNVSKNNIISVEIGQGAMISNPLFP